jgi:hypothetical protein
MVDSGLLQQRPHAHFATEDKDFEHYYSASDMQYLKPLEYMEKNFLFLG